MCKSVFFLSFQSLKTVGKVFEKSLKSPWILHNLACMNLERDTHLHFVFQVGYECRRTGSV